MNRDEFQHKYHNYMTDSKNDAEKECAIVNSQMTDGHEVVVQGFKGFGYCLMLKMSADALPFYFPEIMEEVQK